MTYPSVHTGPEIDAAVSVLSDVQDIRTQVAADKATVTTLAGQTATNATLAQTAATNAQADAASALTSRNEAHTSAQTAGAHAANADSSRALAVVARNGAEQAQDSAWEAEGEVRYLLDESEATIDSIRAEILRQKYGSGPYPSLDIGFVGARVLDRRVTFTRPTDARYWDSLGTLQTAGPNEPRFDYDPVTGESLGLLVEGQATNLLRWSEEFTNALWVKNASTVQLDDEEDGFYRLIENNATGIAPRTEQSVSVVSGRTYTLSIEAKEYSAGAKRYLTIVLVSAAFGSNFRVTVDLATGEYLTQNAPLAVSVKYQGRGVYRVSVTATAVLTGTGGYVQARIAHALIDSLSHVTGDGVSGILIRNAQLEEGTSPTSYIKTEASQVTRAADLANIELGDWYNPDEGTLVIDAPNPGTSVTRGMLTIFNANVSSDVPRIQLVRNPNNRTEVAVVNDAGVVDTPGLYAGSSLAHKTAIGIQDDNLAISTGGNPVAIDNTVAVPRSVTYMRIGATLASYINGHIRGVTYYPRRLDDSKLVELTAQ